MTYDPRVFSGEQSTKPSTSVESNLENNSGSTIDELTPVGVDTAGELNTITVSDEASSLSIVGITTYDISDGGAGSIASTGRVKEVGNLGNFGDIMYVSKAGGLTTTKPSEGVGSFVVDDFVIRIGVIIKNEDNGSLKDLLLSVSVVGQL